MGEIWLIRHSETEWALTGQHTGRSDVPLTERGRREAVLLGRRLDGHPFARVFTSPLSRAADTCRLAGFGDVAEPDPDLMEWDYGAYEGRTTAELQRAQPGWNIWHVEVHGGESVEDVGRRVDRVIERVAGIPGDVALFAHGHVLRILAARWIGLPPGGGERLALDTASLSVLGTEHGTPVIRRWNQPGVEEPGHR